MHYGGGLGSDLEDMPEQTFNEPTEEPTHQPTEEDGEEFLPEPTHRYNLRKKNAGKWVRGKFIADFEQVGIHLSVNKALNKFGKKALREAYREIRQLNDKNVWTPVRRSSMSYKQLKGAIRSSMFFKEKYLSTGEFEKLKARLVAGGDKQDKSIYEDLSSPTAMTQSVYMVAAIAAKEGRHVVTCDIAGAYLNASLKEHDVYMKLDPTLTMILSKIRPDYESYADADGTMMVKLDKALYGCVESAKLWYDHLTDTLESNGYVRNKLDICVFNKYNSKGEQTTVVAHVDDLMITSVSNSSINELLDMLTDKYKEISVTTGKIHSYLGQTFNYSKRGKCMVSMEGYVSDIIITYEVTGKASSPALETLFVVRIDAVKLSTADSIIFHSRVAKLLYLSKRARPDILTAVIFLTTRVLDSDEDDQSKLDRVLRYINSTKDLFLTLELSDTVQVVSYIDAAYGIHMEARSVTGSIITLGKGAFYARSQKQKLVSKSSTEAELIALTDESSQVLWTRNFLILQGYMPGPAIIYQDNMSTMALVEKGRSTSERTRHIDIRYFFIKDRVSNGDLRLVHLPTAEMTADILTKPLQGEAFKRHRSAILNLE